MATKKTMQVRLFKPSLGDEELQSVKGAFDRSWLGLGPKVTEFEQEWARYVGAPTSVGLNSATAALHLALAAFRFKPGSKVLVPAMTFVATASAALYNGLEPVFVDADPVTLGLSMEDLERKVTPDCVAVMPVHFGGHPVPMEKLVPWARQHGLAVIEDCAHCCGGEYLGRKLGMWGDIGCYSFEEKKCMTTGDGGMLSSSQPELIEPLRAHRWIGIDKDTWRRNASYTDGGLDSKHWYYEISVLGYKYNMNDLMASIGLVQLKKLDRMNARRGECIRRYLAGLEGCKTVVPLFPYQLEGASYWIFGLRAQNRDGLILHLKARGIATGVHYTPIPMHPLFHQYASAIPVCEQVYPHMISLPLHADLTDEEVDYVVEAVREFDRTA